MRRAGLALAVGLALGSAAWATERPPIVIVPGAPGSELIDTATGNRVWPNAKMMMSRDGNDVLALPLDDPERTTFVAGPLLRKVHVGAMTFKIHAYGGLEKNLRELGYHEGDWAHPKGDGEYFYVPYDWRQSIETNGRRFYRELTAFYGRCPERTPPAVVLGHSLGGLIARYALMYGDTPLGRSGPLPPVSWAGSPMIAKVFLVATPNEGTFVSLKSLEQGIAHNGHYGAFSPQTLFTYPAVFDMIPKRLDPLVDDKGRPLAIGLDDPEGWIRAGWSILDPRAKSSIPYEDRRAHLARELARHARFWEAMDQLGSQPNPATLYVVAGWSKRVQRSALVVDGRHGATVHFGSSTTRASLKSLLFEPGDAMVPVRSPLADGSSHDPLGSLNFARVVRSKHLHQDLLSSPEMIAALNEVLK